MHKIITYIGQIILAFGLVLMVYARLWGDGIPLTHDGPMQVVRMAGYYLALQQGQFPPRLGPNMANGFGYPVFNFNYPLANIVATGFIRLHVTYPHAYQMTAFLFIGLGAFGTLLWLKQHAVSWSYRILGMVLYVANPFLITQVFVRGGMGEIAFIGIFPWVLLATSAVLKHTHARFEYQILLGVVGGLLALTHNVLVMFCLPALGGYAVWISRSHLKHLVRLIVPVVLAFLLSAFFWIPALAEKDLIVLDQAPITQDFEKHFLWFHQLLSGSRSYGFSRPGPVDGMPFQLSYVESFIIVLMSCWYLAHYQQEKKRAVLLLSVLGIFLLPTTIVEPLWQWIPFGNYIQFPWRLLWFGHMGLLALIVIWFMRISVSKKWLSVVIIVCLIEAFITARPLQQTNRTAEEWLRAGETTSTTNENAPKTFQLDSAYQVKDHIFGDQLVWVSTPSAQVRIETWDGTKRTYRITTPEPVTVVERTAYFSGWETSVNQQRTTISADDPWHVGLLTYQLPAGSFIVKSSFTQHTVARMIGNGLTLVGLGLSFLWIIIYVKKK